MIDINTAELAHIFWAAPAWLLTLPLPWLIAFSMRDASATHNDVVLVHPAPPRTMDTPVIKHRIWLWVQALGISLLVLAMARPQSLGDWLPQEPVGQRVVLVVDASASMNIDDFLLDGQPITRLEVLKGVVTRFVRARHGSHFGIVAFAGNAFTFVPITDDRHLVMSMLSRVQVGIADAGTAIGDALALALKQIREGQGPRPIVMLFTDGESERGQVRPREALALAKELQVPLYTVAVTGTVEQRPRTVAGKEEPTLREMAEQTGGHYYRAGDTATLEAVIRDVDRLEKTVTPPPAARDVREWYIWPLWSGVFMLLLAQVLRETHKGQTL